MSKLYLLPLITPIIFIVCFAVTYITAVQLKDVPTLYPYISDTGTFSPESCIFGQCLNMGSLLMGLIAYLRYRQVRYIYENHPIDKDTRTLNKISLWLGVIGALGVSIVANFQETNIFSVHLLGAFLAFGLGTVYMYTSTKVCYKIYPILGTKSINKLRIFFTIMCAINSTICFGTAVVSFLQFDVGSVAYLRYRQIRFLYENHQVDKLVRKCNKLSLWLGVIGSIGLSIVANFQVTSILPVHMLGAFLSFGLGFLYMSTATFVSVKMYPVIGTKFVNNMRIGFSAMCGIATSITFGAGVVSAMKFKGTDMTKWKKEDGGFISHAVSSVSEWISAFSMASFIALYTNDFKLLTMAEPAINVVIDTVQVQQPAKKDENNDI